MGTAADAISGSLRSRLAEELREIMATTAKNVKFRKQLAKLEASRRTPDKVKMPPRERIRIRLRCKLCGRPRAVYRKFGICRICFRDMASDGLIPGVKKASW
jgi:small subunit ribosomal protein S14